MAAAEFDFETYGDADFIRTHIYKDDEGDPISLEGGRLRMNVRKNALDATALIALTSDPDGGINISDIPGGAFDYRLPLTRLRVLPSGLYVHSMVFERPDGIVDVVFRGNMTHYTGITR